MALFPAQSVGPGASCAVTLFVEVVSIRRRPLVSKKLVLIVLSVFPTVCAN